jgi:hypothetical protein
VCSKLNAIYIAVVWFKTEQLGDNNPDKCIRALLLETIAEEFPRETYECDIIIIMAPFLIVVGRHETLMQRSDLLDPNVA